MITYNDDNSITIDGWEQGISNSAKQGFQDIRGMNVNEYPGMLAINARLNKVTNEYSAGITFTASTIDSTITTSSNMERPINASGLAVTFSSSVALPTTTPTQIVAGTTYYLYENTSTNFKIATSYYNAINGTYLTITGAGTGTHTITPIVPKKINFFTRSIYDEHNQRVYGLDIDGRVWISRSNGSWNLLEGNTLPSANEGGHGLVCWREYLFVFRKNDIDIFKEDTWETASLTWSNSWASTSYVYSAAQGLMSTNAPIHYSIVGEDDIIYYCNSGESGSTRKVYYLGSIMEKPGQVFDPALNTTYTISSKALDLPEIPVSLAELGENLVIGTDSNKAFPWDRRSPSYNFPYKLPEKTIDEMVSVNNILYFLAGRNGIIYRTNGSLVEPYKKIPETISHTYYNNTAASGFEFVGAVSVFNKILFTAKMLTSTASSPSAALVFSVNLDNDVMVIENVMPGTSTSNIAIGDIFSYGTKVYTTSWKTDTEGGIISNYDLSNNNFNMLDSLDSVTASATTELFPVSTETNVVDLNQIEINMANKQGTISIEYRKSIEDSWTPISSITDLSPASGPNGKDITVANCNIEGIRDLQLRITLKASFSSQNVRYSPILRSIRLCR